MKNDKKVTSKKVKTVKKAVVTMRPWETMVCSMLECTVGEIPPEVRQRLTIVDRLVKEEGGVLVSRQAIALAIASTIPYTPGPPSGLISDLEKIGLVAQDYDGLLTPTPKREKKHKHR